MNQNLNEKVSSSQERTDIVGPTVGILDGDVDGLDDGLRVGGLVGIFDGCQNNSASVMRSMLVQSSCNVKNKIL